MTRIAIIVGTTRPQRKSAAVAEWVLEHAGQRDDARFELVDLRDHVLPLFDEPFPPMKDRYENAHTFAWSETVAAYDGYVMVTGEYNHSVPASLKNAIDYLNKEWANKAVGFVGYGSAGGARAVEHLRQIAGELQLADVRGQVQLTLAHDFEAFTTFRPGPQQAGVLSSMLDQVVAWSAALAPLRAPAAQPA